MIDRIGASDGVLINGREAIWTYKHKITTNPQSNTFTQKVTLKLDYMSSAANSGEIDIDFKCGGYCTLSTVTWDGSKTFLKGETRELHGTVTGTWTGTGQSTIMASWVYRGKINSSYTWNSESIEHGAHTTRCDNEVVNAGTGCVFSWYSRRT